MYMMRKLLLIILILWIVARFARWYYVSKWVKRPPATLVQERGNIQQKDIWPMIVATVTVPWDQSQALNQWFRILAGYIFGGNTSQASIKMTAPVLSESQSEKISMTAPVLSATQSDDYVVSFVMPEWYTLDTLPTPNNKNISFREVPKESYYVRSFAWYAYESRSNKQLSQFRDNLVKSSLNHTGDFQLAQYNDPWTPPMLRENEWWVKVSQ